MINAKELRLSNCLLDENKNTARISGFRPFGHSTRCDEKEGCYVLFDILFADGTESRNWTCDINEMQPIPLTPEVLEACGFDWSVYHQAWHYGDSLINEFYDLAECYPSGYQLQTFKGGALIGNPIHHLHTLQNLYFSLTGQELEYKNK